MDTQGICEGGLADAGNDGEQVLGQLNSQTAPVVSPPSACLDDPADLG